MCLIYRFIFKSNSERVGIFYKMQIKHSELFFYFIFEVGNPFLEGNIHMT